MSARALAGKEVEDLEDTLVSESAASSDDSDEDDEDEGSEIGLDDNPVKALQIYWYESTVRIRATFFAFNALATLLAISMSYIAHVFFEVMGSAEVGPAMACNLYALPILLVLSATLVDEMVDLILDGMASPSLGAFRATLVTSLHACFPRSHGRGAEVCVLAMFEGLPLLAVLINIATHGGISSLRSLAAAYCVGGMFCVDIWTLVYVVMHVHVARWPGLEPQMVQAYKKVDHLGRLTPVLLDDQSRPTSKRRCPRGATILLAALAIQACSVLGCFLIGGMLQVQLTMVCQLLVVILGAVALNSCVPGLLGRAFAATLAIFTALTVVLWVGAVQQVPTVVAMKRPPLCLGPGAAGYGEGSDGLPIKFTPPLDGEGYGYPVCSGHWGNRNMTTDNQLTVFDLASLAYASYLPSRDNIAERLGTMFAGTSLQSWDLQEVESNQTVGRWVVVDFPKQKVRVIAVRGTSNLRDAFADLELYARVTVFQLMNRFTPIMPFLGSENLRRFMKLNLVAKVFRVKGFWEHFYEVVADRKRAALQKGYSVVITGHSLGGALAGAAAAREGIQGVGFSPPGLFYQTSRLGIRERDLRYTFTEIQPAGDVVPRVDVQRGAVNWIKCAKSPGTCHHLTKTSCELWSRCGDPRGRDWRRTCLDAGYSKEDLNL